MNSLSDLLKTLRTIKKHTEWGENQNIQSCLKYLDSEISELEEAVASKNHENIADELGDVLMMSLFFLIYLEDMSDYDFQAINRLIIKKLKDRYPLLFEKKSYQLKLFESFETTKKNAEKTEWYKQKKNRKLLKYCYCTNSKCKNYLKPGADDLKIFNDERRWVFCATCKTKFPLEEACLFSSTRSDRDLLIKSLFHYVKQREHKEKYKHIGIGKDILNRALKLNTNETQVLSNILRSNYGELDLIKYLDIKNNELEGK